MDTTSSPTSTATSWAAGATVPAAEVLHLLRLLAATGPRERALLAALSAALRHRDLLAHPHVAHVTHAASGTGTPDTTDDPTALADSTGTSTRTGRTAGRGIGRARSTHPGPGEGRTKTVGDPLAVEDDLIDWPATVADAAVEVEDRLRDVENAYSRPLDDQDPPTTTPGTPTSTATATATATATGTGTGTVLEYVDEPTEVPTDRGGRVWPDHHRDDGRWCRWSNVSRPTNRDVDRHPDQHPDHSVGRDARGARCPDNCSASAPTNGQETP